MWEIIPDLQVMKGRHLSMPVCINTRGYQYRMYKQTLAHSCMDQGFLGSYYVLGGSVLE